MYEARQNQKGGAAVVQDGEGPALPRRGSAQEDFGSFMGERSLKNGGMRASVETTNELFKDANPDAVAKLSPDHLRRIAFNAAILADWQAKLATPLAAQGMAVLTQRFAVNMLHQAVAQIEKSTA